MSGRQGTEHGKAPAESDRASALSTASRPSASERGTPPALGELFTAQQTSQQRPPRRQSGQRSRRWAVATLLLLLTAASTLYVGGWQYGLWIVVILAVHEAGHFLPARRHGLRASPPYFIPFPLPPFGTLGAVIQLRRRLPHRRALFDMAIGGPLAGLVPILWLAVVGVRRSAWVPAAADPWPRDETLLFKVLGHWLLGAPPTDHVLALHPMAMAAWVGMFITALNLIPMGQLDGGHILYALLGRRAHGVSLALLAVAGCASAVLGYWQWLVPLAVLAVLGLRHPPTLDDGQELGGVRTLLGWLMLLFVLVGWSPRPLITALG